MYKTNTALALLAATLLIGCAADPGKRAVVAQSQAERLARPSEALSHFGKFELADMTSTGEIQSDKKKAQAAAGVAETLKQRVQPLLTDWNTRHEGNAERTLLVEPRVVELYIPGGGSRFWAGAFAGESVIEMQIKMTEKGSGALIGQVNVRRTAGAMAGAWSIGKSDKNLVIYVADIVHKYLEDSYKFAP